MMWVELKAPVGINACRGICIMFGIIGVKIAMTVSIPLGLKSLLTLQLLAQPLKLQMVVFPWCAVPRNGGMGDGGILL